MPYEDGKYVPDTKRYTMDISTLYNIYNAGFTHGVNEGPFPEHGTFEAFHRLIEGKSPTEDGVSYDIAHKIVITDSKIFGITEK